MTSRLFDRFEPRFVLAHLEDVSPDGAPAGTPEFGTGVFSQLPYLEFLRARRPDLDLIAEHIRSSTSPPCVAASMSSSTAEDRTASPIS